MGNNIIIYGVTKERAFSKLQSLLDEMRHGDVVDVRKSNYEFVVILNNGDVYRAVCASNTARGIKWQYAYIDSVIDEDIMDEVILPSFAPRYLSNGYDVEVKVLDRIKWY